MQHSSRRNFLKSATGVGFILMNPAEYQASHQWLIQSPNSLTYLESIRNEMNLQWPKNKAINLVFHGHSVPAGYFKTPVVNTLQSYPYLLLNELKKKYPYAVINIINTSIGGENSIKGAARFKKEVLCHKPDVLFIDYALNDQHLPLSETRHAWEYMIKTGLKNRVKLILLTATPDQRVDLMDNNTPLQKNCDQIVELSDLHKIGLVDSYKAFQQLISSNEKITDYMSQVNHPNEKGHQLVADGIMNYFNET